MVSTTSCQYMGITPTRYKGELEDIDMYTNICCIYEPHLSPTLNRNTVIQHFEQRDASEIRVLSGTTTCIVHVCVSASGFIRKRVN